MKRFLFFVFVAITALTCFPDKADAKGVIIYGNGPEFVKLHNLPDSITMEDQHVNFGVGFQEFDIFWLPLWTYGEVEYVVMNDAGDTAWSLDEEDLGWISEEYGIDISKGPSVPFWHSIGGKLVALAIIAGLWFFSRSKKKKEGEEEAPLAGDTENN